MPIHGMDRVNKAIDKRVDDMNKGVKAVYFRGLSEVIERTPVHIKDGGRLKNNWFLSVSTPYNASTLIAHEKGANSFMQLGRIPKMVLGKKIYFTNNLVYAPIVEYGGYPLNVKRGTYIGGGKYQKLSAGGYSRQAPSGMARIALNNMQRYIKQI